MTDLIVKSGVKEALEDNPVSADFYEAVNDKVAKLLNEAAPEARGKESKTALVPELRPATPC